MSRALARFDPADFFVPIGVGLSAVVLGGLAGIEPKLAVGVALGIAFALITLANLSIGVAAFTLVMFFELSPVAGGSALSFTKLAGAILLISWIASFTSRDHGRNTLWNRHPILSLAIVAFCAWVSLSFVWAEHPSIVPAETLRLLLTAVLFLILYEAIRTPQHIRMVLGAFIAGATFAALYGVVATPDASQFAYAAGSEGLNRIAGTVGDPNVLAATLVAGLMISVAMGFSQGRSSAVRSALLYGCCPVPCGRPFDRVARRPRFPGRRDTRGNRPRASQSRPGGFRRRDHRAGRHLLLRRTGAAGRA